MNCVTPIEVEIIESTESTEQYPTVVSTNNIETQTTRRQGQDIVRELTLENYGYQCAFCDVSDEQLLVASYISRWADDHKARGNLSNVICLCKFHDSLFEDGYLSLSDDYKVLKKSDISSETINLLLKATNKFRLPKANFPKSEFLLKHRLRTGFEKTT